MPIGICKNLHKNENIMKQSNLELYTELTLRCHELNRIEDDDDEKWDKVIDECEYLNSIISIEDLRIIENVSGDLYMLQNKDIYFIVEDENKHNKNKLNELIESKNWIDVLELLRMSIGLERELIAKYRSEAYEQLGCKLASLKFKEYHEKIKT